MKRPEPFDPQAANMGADLVNLTEAQFLDKYGVGKEIVRTKVIELGDLIVRVEKDPSAQRELEELIRTMSFLERAKRNA